MTSGTREPFEGPDDPEPCSCDEALALGERVRVLEEKLEAAEQGRLTFREMARHRGDLLLTEVERRLAAERQVLRVREALRAVTVDMRASAVVDLVQAALRG